MFFLQFGEFNLIAPPYSKTLITQELPTLFRSTDSQDHKTSSCVNVALENCKIFTFLFIYLSIESAIIKGAIYFSVSGYSEETWCASCSLRKVIKASWLFHMSVQTNFSSTHIMQRNGSIKSLPWSGLLLPLYELMKLGVLAKWTLKWP